MATPHPNQWSAALNDFAGITIRDYVRSHYDPAKDILLDIGAGWAKYKLLLPEFTMDAVEIWEPYVEQNKLREQYRRVFAEDVTGIAFEPNQYSAAIIGDTLEHLTATEARRLLDYLLDGRIGQVIIAVPYLMDQDEWDGNKYEKHLQPDLTHELVLERYPMMERIGVEGNKGVYVTPLAHMRR